MTTAHDRSSLHVQGSSAAQTIASLASAPSKLVDSNVMDYFLIAMVETLRCDVPSAELLRLFRVDACASETPLGLLSREAKLLFVESPALSGMNLIRV